ncbi:MAG: radical SAM protein [Geminicoccaceae bacterium]|nr:radical SAM protein [Geminicoccaceae bacterium]MCX8102442.1 radical SAM protein [Geminicoccaceae bacterium]MDW8371308.1 radical SAM protein [Geminicoccaceae bacterium]
MYQKWFTFDRVGHLRRQARTIFRLATPRRIRNYLLNRREFAAKKLVLESLPPKMIFDPANVCNLRCPLCATGVGSLAQKSGYMRYELFKKVYDQVRDDVAFVNLYNWGEPFLSPDIFKIIDEVAQSGAISHLHSNFSLKKQGLIEKIAESPLTSIVLSIDGASETGYQTYRKRGDWNLVQQNIRKFVAHRRARGGKGPELVWKFIVHRKNEHEVERVPEVARASGVDRLQLTFMWADLVPGFDSPQEKERWAAEWMPIRHKEFAFDARRKPVFDRPCHFLWQDPVVNIDGTVLPCCFLHAPEHNFGDLKKHSFKEIWNNDIYRYSRSLFSDEPYVGPPVKSPCTTCTLFRHRRPVASEPVEVRAAA